MIFIGLKRINELIECMAKIEAVCEEFLGRSTTQKMKFSLKNFFSKCDQIRSKLENFIFCAVIVSLVNPFHAEAATGGVL